MIDFFGITLVISILLGFFAPAPPIRMTPAVLRVVLWTSGITVLIGIAMICLGNLEDAIYFGAFGEILFCLMMWTEAPRKNQSRSHHRPQRRAVMPPPIHVSELDVDWERMEQERASWR